MPTSGQWTESLTVLNAQSLAVDTVPDASAFLGVSAASDGAVYVSAGGRNQVLVYKQAGPGRATGPSAFSSAIPPLASSAGMGFAALGYPGNSVLGPGGWLYVAGTLSVPQKTIDAADPGAGTCPSGADRLGGPLQPGVSSPGSCAVTEALQVGGSTGTPPGAFRTTGPVPTHLIPVGQDADGITLDAATDTLYVSNWADGAVSSRGGSNGTISVVKLAPGGGSGKEVMSVGAGKEPMGIALSPNGRELAVANALSDTVTLCTLGPHGLVLSTRTVRVGYGPTAPKGAQPVAVSFTPNGRDHLVFLFGLDALEVLTAQGDPIPETVGISQPGRPTAQLTVPVTFVPTGWMPWAFAFGPEPTARAAGAGDVRLHVANFQGMGAGPGFYNPASATVGTSATEGSVSVVDVPQTLSAGGVLATDTAQTIAADDLVPLVDPSVKGPATDPCMRERVPGGPPIARSFARPPPDRSTARTSTSWWSSGRTRRSTPCSATSTPPSQPSTPRWARTPTVPRSPPTWPAWPPSSGSTTRATWPETSPRPVT